MSKIFHISEAASLALHSLTLIAQEGRQLSTHDIATQTGFSKNHLSKVLQILVRNGYLQSTRGPKGGFVLSLQPEYITLLEIYELFEGKLTQQICSLHGNSACPFNECLFGKLNKDFSTAFYKHMKHKTIEQLINKKTHHEKNHNKN